MGHEYELSGDSREALIFTKDQLLAPLPDGSEDTPHTDAEVAARGIAYYPGIASQNPLARYHDTPAGPEEVDGPARTVLEAAWTQPAGGNTTASNAPSSAPEDDE